MEPDDIMAGINTGGSSYAPPDLGPQKISGDEDYEKLKPGTTYLDPEGNQRIKPIASDADYYALPEGAKYVDPEGNTRQKPSYEGVNFTAQTLHDMALSEKGKRQALELSYPGKVREQPGAEGKNEIYIDDDGVLRKPGRGLTGVAGHLAAETAPMGGMLGGMVLGAGGGTAAGPAGTVGGGVAGMTLGTMAGQSFNNIILRLSGVDESTQSEIGAIGNAGLGAVAGEGAGRLIAKVPAAVVQAKGMGGAAYSKLADFLGVNKETLPDALKIAEHGEKPAEGVLSGLRNALGLTETETPVRPSAIFMESPKTHLNVEVLDPAFRTQNVLKKGEEKYYGDKAGELFDEMGLQRPASYTKPQSDVSTQQAGEMLTARALRESEVADAEMQQILLKRKADIEMGLQPQFAQREQILAANQKVQDEASNLIGIALKDVEKTSDDALATLKAGSNSGDFWWLVSEKFKAVRDAIGTKYRRNMDNAYAVAGQEPLPTGSLAETAEQFLKTVPEELKARMPVVTRDIAKLAADAEGEGGVATFQQLHQLRTMLRQQADYLDLPSDIKNGQLKFFAKQIDDVLQSGAEGTNLHLAARMMNANDAWYGKEIGIFDSSEIGAVMKGLKGGEAADPAKLYSTLVKPNNTDTINRVHEVVGDNVWSGVKSAQKKNWLQKAGTADPNKPDAVKFANEVVDAYHDGTLMAVQGKEEGEKLFKLAQMVHALEGKIDVNVNPGDTAFDIMRKAYRAGVESADLAKQDPLKALTHEVRKIERLGAQEAKLAKSKDPLSFLSDKTTGANAAVEKILANEDLIIASEARFGRDSPEFKALQQVWAEKIFTGTNRPGEGLKNVSPEVQKIMLGTSLETAQQLAREVALMRGNRNLGKQTAQGMMAVNAITHPFGTLGSSKGLGQAAVKSAAKMVPGSDIAGRATLEKYYALMQKVATSPGLLRNLEKGMNGGIQDKEGARQLIASIINTGGKTGAAVGESIYQGSPTKSEPRPMQPRRNNGR